MALPAARGYRHFLGDQEELNVDVTSPCGSTVTTDTPTVSWTFSPGTQASYRVRVCTDSICGFTAYDSGVIAGGAQSLVVPGSLLTSGLTYWVLVEITTVEGDVGSNVICSFETLFPTSVNITGLTVTAINDECFDPASLPGIQVRWNQIVPGAGETFIQYDIFRRLARLEGTTGTRIATIATITTTVYNDYNVAAWEVYEYWVVWRATTATGTKASAKPAVPPWTQVRFEFAFVHDLADPTRWLRFDSWSHTDQRVQDVALNQVWGRPHPTAQIGEALSYSIDVGGLPLSRNEREVAWEKLEDLQERQRDNGSLMVVRFGRDRFVVFCVIVDLSRDVRQTQFEPKARFQQVNHEEAV